MIALLARHSRSAWEVGYSGHVDRLRELLTEQPERARGYDGETLLMYLPPDDETKAMEVATLLLEHGADPTIGDPQGKTAADRAELNAMYRVAALLRDADIKTLQNRQRARRLMREVAAGDENSQPRMRGAARVAAC
jgi:ankyrin repeat protein